MKKQQLFGSLMLLLASVIWGLQYSVQSLASELGTFTVVFFKSIGGILLLILAIIKKERFNKKTIVWGMVIGLVSCLGVLAQQEGLSLSSAANASFITALYIVFTPILGLFIGRKPNIKTCIAILISLLGMYFLCIDGEFIISSGDLILVFGAIMFALQIILIDRLIKDVDAIAFTAVQQIISAIVSATFMLIIEKPSISTITMYLPHALYLAIFAGASAQFIQNRFQRDVEPNVASIIMSFESVFGAIFGWIILNQALTTKEIIGCVLMFVAMMMVE